MGTHYQVKIETKCFKVYILNPRLRGTYRIHMSNKKSKKIVPILRKTYSIQRRVT